jgi:CheY-like chemotaxis protein
MTGQPTQPKTILVVEDEAHVRAMMTRALLEEGYRVLEAGDGEQALAVVLATGAKIDLLVTDIVMPNMGGLGWPNVSPYTGSGVEQSGEERDRASR